MVDNSICEEWLSKAPVGSSAKSSFGLLTIGDSMKLAICTVTLILLFLIWFVNNYMLRCRQKEFAVQAILGMEAKTIGRLFFAETFVMGICAVGLGIVLGVENKFNIHGFALLP